MIKEFLKTVYKYSSLINIHHQTQTRYNLQTDRKHYEPMESYFIQHTVSFTHCCLNLYSVGCTLKKEKKKKKKKRKKG